MLISKRIFYYFNALFFFISLQEGPTSHDQPTYASVPGIKVYGMVCINKADAPIDDNQLKRKVRLLDDEPSKSAEGKNIQILKFMII